MTNTVNADISYTVQEILVDIEEANGTEISVSVEAVIYSVNAQIDDGPQGPQGPAGQGVPAGGTVDQVIVKSSSTDYDTAWQHLWINLVTGWWVTPTLLQTIATGDVYSYNYGATTLYRLVPSGAEVDSFYSDFTGGVLSGLVVAKRIEV